MNTPWKRVLLCLLVPVFSALAAAQSSIDAGQTTANIFESSYFHFRYDLPKGWFALDDRVRLADNKKRYKTQLAEALKKNGPNTPTRKTEVFPQYDLLSAGRTKVTSSEMTQLPCVHVWATRRVGMTKEAADPAKLITLALKPKVLRGPEKVVLAGHEFVRADFQFSPKSFLSKFTSVSGDYLIEFDLRAKNEKDLVGLAATMQTLRFPEP